MTPGELQERLRVISIVVCRCPLNPNHTGVGLIQANYVSTITADAMAPSHRQVISNHDVKCGCSDLPTQPALHHYNDGIMGATASEITSLAIVYSSVYSGADETKHQSSASLSFVWWIHRWPVNSPHKWPVTWKMFLFDDVIVLMCGLWWPHMIWTKQPACCWNIPG